MASIYKKRKTWYIRYKDAVLEYGAPKLRLRHTTASLLRMNRVNPAAVQRILRHSDPKITTEVYGHLSPVYLRAEADKLSFNPRAIEETIGVVEGEGAQAVNVTPFVTGAGKA